MIKQICNYMYKCIYCYIYCYIYVTHIYNNICYICYTFCYVYMLYILLCIYCYIYMFKNQSRTRRIDPAHTPPAQFLPHFPLSNCRKTGANYPLSFHFSWRKCGKYGKCGNNTENTGGISQKWTEKHTLSFALMKSTERKGWAKSERKWAKMSEKRAKIERKWAKHEQKLSEKRTKSVQKSSSFLLSFLCIEMQKTDQILDFSIEESQKATEEM